MPKTKAIRTPEERIFRISLVPSLQLHAILFPRKAWWPISKAEKKGTDASKVTHVPYFDGVQKCRIRGTEIIEIAEESKIEIPVAKLPAKALISIFTEFFYSRRPQAKNIFSI